MQARAPASVSDKKKTHMTLDLYKLISRKMLFWDVYLKQRIWIFIFSLTTKRMLITKSAI